MRRAHHFDLQHVPSLPLWDPNMMASMREEVCELQVRVINLMERDAWMRYQVFVALSSAMTLFSLQGDGPFRRMPLEVKCKLVYMVCGKDECKFWMPYPRFDVRSEVPLLPSDPGHFMFERVFMHRHHGDLPFEPIANHWRVVSMKIHLVHLRERMRQSLCSLLQKRRYWEDVRDVLYQYHPGPGRHHLLGVCRPAAFSSCFELWNTVDRIDEASSEDWEPEDQTIGV